MHPSSNPFPSRLSILRLRFRSKNGPIPEASSSTFLSLFFARLRYRILAKPFCANAAKMAKPPSLEIEFLDTSNFSNVVFACKNGASASIAISPIKFVRKYSFFRGISLAASNPDAMIPISISLSSEFSKIKTVSEVQTFRQFASASKSILRNFKPVSSNTLMALELGSNPSTAFRTIRAGLLLASSPELAEACRSSCEGKAPSEGL